MDNRANIHAQDDKTLILAAENNYNKVVKLLLENGADIHAQNNRVYEQIKKLNKPKSKDFINNGI